GSDRLREHKKEHKKPHICELCRREFKRWHNLQEHMRIHTGAVYQCQFPGCGRNFQRSYDLQGHMGIHRRLRRLQPANQL
ncbi:hypothetical protein B0H65DRAFT_389998, partial [Neurospora tetraspora]